MTIFQPHSFALALLFTFALLQQPAATATTVSVTPTPGTTGTPGVAATATTAATTPEDAVRTLLASFITPGATGTTCNALSRHIQGCPITPRLLTRLQSATENGNIVSRSQNPPQDVTITTLDNNGTTAHVNTIWRFGSFTYTIIFTAVSSGGGWLVDDSLCASQPNSSIFNVPAGPCPADVVPGPTPSGDTTTPLAQPSSTPAVPGVPKTGGGDNTHLTIILVALAILTAVAGLVLSFSARSRSSGM